MPKILNNQKGTAHLLLLIAALGIILTIAITSSTSFKNQLFSSIFPKPSSKAAGDLVTTAYTIDESIFPNPERGFHSPAELTTSNSLPTSTAKSAGNSIVHTNFRLDSFRTSAISQAMLDTVTNALNTARAQGVKLVIRFMYNAGPWPTCQPDASESWIHTHLGQLKPILEANTDVIAAFDAGIIGCWGEWHTSTNNLTELGAKTRVIKDILANFPASKQVQMRTPAHIRDVWPSLTEDERKRIAFHNDCFLASADDEGTFENATADKAYIAAIGVNNVVGGETCAVSSRSVCSTAITEMQQMHYSHINEGYEPNVIQGWKDGGCFQTMKKNLGYRLSLINATYPTTANPGDSYQLQASIKNDGYASIYNPRPVFAVLYNSTNTYTFPLTVDPKSWKSMTTNSINETFILPTNIATGTYKLALWLPDSSTGLRTKPAYSIRLANTGVWDSTLGYNILASNINITTQTSTPAPTSSPAATPLATPTIAPTPVPTPTPSTTLAPTPTPIAGPITPAAPVITKNVSCINSGFSGNAVTISWTNPAGGNPVSYVDISTSSSYSSYYNKSVAGLSSTTAPNGFAMDDTSALPLLLNPNTTYFVQLYNNNLGYHSPTVSFSIPECTKTTGSSVVTIYAAGTPSSSVYPTMRLQILNSSNNWSNVKTWTNVNGNANTPSYNSYIYTSAVKLLPSQIRVRFTNDKSSSTAGDRNLRIDKINIDGVDYQSESPTVYISSCTTGYKQTEWLNCNGYFMYK